MSLTEKNMSNLKESGDIQGVEISGLYQDSKNNVWFSVENDGVYKFDGKQFY